tara:strand:- start:104 stop:457 length:354 start_codon:yes stop_codon:yes gene_type:complete
MSKNVLNKIEELIKNKKINEAQLEISKLGPQFHKNVEYLYLRSKIFYINKLYYQALDALLIATEFGEEDKIYDLISEIYNILGNEVLSKKISDRDSRLQAVKALKKEVTGISQKEKS